MSTSHVTVEPPPDDQPGLLRSFRWASPMLRVSGDIASTPTGLTISRLVIEPAPGRVLTHRLVQSVPIGEILAAARADLAGDEPVKTTPPPPAGRVVMTDELLRQVALAYIEETGPGKDRAVLARMAARFERPPRTVRAWITRARDEGWLGPATQGRMGAEPGPRLAPEVTDEDIEKAHALAADLIREAERQAEERQEELHDDAR